ncbi:hypothetical protein DOTSEDRAFT_156730 [Lecanosticta acicola]|uniref:RRM domain-containing protein n=1 Tax=Lecanosticta acicola TaxID=111012 RepID=A0AAI8Z3R0_9PEZI|nr:hypothetical protein DOTSEDRAFT_156730 [Lecanosticta acicola]
MVSSMEKVTVDKSYFDALLRRADFVRSSSSFPLLLCGVVQGANIAMKHTSAQLLGRPDPASVTISRVEYDNLLRNAREFEMLKNALFDGGLTPETLAQLIAGASVNEPRRDSLNAWADDFDDTQPPYNGQSQSPCPTAGPSGLRNEASWRAGNSHSASNYYGHANGNDHHPANTNLRVPGARYVSNGVTPSSVPDIDDASSFVDDAGTEPPQNNAATLRTLYFCGFPARTTYRDLLSVIKGGKLLSVNLRSERSATVSFLDAAPDYLAWVTRNDIYLHAKRVDVRWADRQFSPNGHVSNKIANGATRNILIRSALDKGLTEASIREDMEHIHNLVIIDVTFKNGNAYVSTNSVHNALFARTCMMSRNTYKGCKIEFYPDECDVPLPARAQLPKPIPREPTKKHISLVNRFGMLDIDGSDSGEENRDPDDQIGDSDEDDDDTVNIKARHGVRLDFLDSESTA